MKTILLPIYSGMRSRNFFRNDSYTELVKDGNTRLVILVPPYKLDFYRQQFRNGNVIFESWRMAGEPWLGEKLASAAFNLIDTLSMKTLQRVAYLHNRKLFKYWSKRIFTTVLGNRRFVRRLVRRLDGFVAINPEAEAFLDRYRPDLVLITDIMYTPDRVLLRAAKRKGYPTVATVRSWDNLTTRGFIQLLPDKLIVHASFMKDEAIKYSDMPAQDVAVLGIPHFDVYFQGLKPDREKFFRKLNIPLNKRLVLCAPFFDTYSHKSGLNIVSNLLKAIETGSLPDDVHIIVRYRPESMGQADPSEQFLKNNPRVTLTMPYTHTFPLGPRRRPDFEYSDWDMELFFNSLYFSDVTINTISTLTVDAIALDKPVINVRFDGDPDTPPANQIKNYSQLMHYLIIEEAGAARLAYSMDQLIDYTAMFLKNPQLDAEAREAIRQSQIEFMDGQSGKRYADYIKKILNHEPKS